MDMSRISQEILKNLTLQHTIETVLFTASGNDLGVIRYGMKKKKKGGGNKINVPAVFSYAIPLLSISGIVLYYRPPV